MMMPTWLYLKLATQAGLRGARSGVCLKCRRPVLRGLDHDKCAMTAEVDAYPISALGEAVALLRGATTFDLALTGGTYELHYRYRQHVGQVRSYPVFVAHDCSYFYHPAEEAFTEDVPVAELPDEPPF